jgi:metallo-beta-lactamase family protein
MSAHGDYEDLLRFLSCQSPELVKKIFLVHGEFDVQTKFKQRLIDAGFKDIVIPKQHQKEQLGAN